jgi:hypothetical protein
MLTAALALGAPLPASAAEKAIWGPLKLPDGRSAFPTYRHLGVDTLQMSLEWSQAAPSRPRRPRDPNDPAYRWPAELDTAVREARGINVAVLAHGSPRWANGGRSRIHAPDPAAFADFLRAASRRYPSVRRWMIWGEPNRADRFRPNGQYSQSAPRVYARLLNIAYGALKSASRRNIVIGGMTWTGGDIKPAPFLRRMRLPNGRPPRLDWFGHNPFPYRRPFLKETAHSEGFRDISDVDTFGREIRRAYRRTRRRPRLWLSEFTVLSGKPSRDFDQYFSKRTQAGWLRDAYDIANRVPSVAGLGWLSLVDEPEATGSSNWGLLTASGTRKPSFFAYRYRAAPSRRFRPRVRAPRRVPRARLGRSGIVIRVRPRISGRVRASLVTSRGRSIARGRRTLRPGRFAKLRLRGAGRPAGGRLRLVVDARRGERVTKVVVAR